MTKNGLQHLKSATTLSDLAKILNIKPSALSFILYFMEKKGIQKYVNFKLKKKASGTRIIHVPNARLKTVQNRLSDLLYICLDEINKDKNITHPIAFAYLKNKTIIDNATVHKNKKYVFNIDLKDFFDSINFGRVYGYFIKNNNFKLDSKVATIIAQIACYQNKLPQGSPCSPIISHLIASILDQRLLKLAKKAGCSYTRYCDDITFSTNKKEFPELIARFDKTDWKPSNILIDIIKRSGFEINDDKVRMNLYYSQQSVTGLVVNKKVNTPRKYRDTVRAMVHQLYSEGDFTFNENFKKDKRTQKNKLNCLEGMLTYIRHIDEKTKLKDKAPQKNMPLSKNQQVFKNFVLYRYFFNNDQIAIFGEGKTDKFHLQHYLKYRKDSVLTTPLPENFEKWQDLAIYQFDRKIFDCISKDGGTGDINNFISNYKKDCHKFYVSEQQKPIIILVDNDKGSKGIFSSIKTIQPNNDNVDGSKDFYYIAYNLYVVVLPEIKKNDTAIEDYYPKSVLNLTYQNKIFSKQNQYNKETHYGKNIFATKVIPNNKDRVDWSNFDKIFMRIQLVIEDFEIRKQHESQDK